MAHLWIHQADGWAVLPLERDSLTLDQIRHAARPGATGPGCAALRRTAHGREEWHLVAEPGACVAVNGLPVATGLRTLADRDELRVPGLGRLYFSSERLARVEPLPETGREVSCPRCRQRIAPLAPAVRCPGCDLWHHQSDDLPCWTYAVTCALCQQSTEASAGFRWTPEAS